MDSVDHNLLNTAIAIYLGDEGGKPGITPGAEEDRLKRAYPSNWELLYFKIKPILKRINDVETDWTKEDLKAASDRVEIMLKKDFPWLSNVAVGKLTNYFAYLWR